MNTALHYAFMTYPVDFNGLEFVKVLLAAGAKPDLESKILYSFKDRLK